MAHAEEEEMSEDKQRESKLLGYTAEDDPALDRPNHGRGKRHAARGSLLEHPKGSSECSGPVIGAW